MTFEMGDGTWFDLQKNPVNLSNVIECYCLMVHTAWLCYYVNIHGYHRANASVSVLNVVPNSVASLLY